MTPSSIVTYYDIYPSHTYIGRLLCCSYVEHGIKKTNLSLRSGRIILRKSEVRDLQRSFLCSLSRLQRIRNPTMIVIPIKWCVGISPSHKIRASGRRLSKL
jgi:hypothetical protein